MERTRNELLSRARLAADKNGTKVRPDTLDLQQHPPYSLSLPDHPELRDVYYVRFLGLREAQGRREGDHGTQGRHDYRLYRRNRALVEPIK
jgi:hypothetical protein